MTNKLLDRIERIVEAERSALLAGDFNILSELAEEKLLVAEGLENPTAFDKGRDMDRLHDLSTSLHSQRKAAVSSSRGRTGRDQQVASANRSPNHPTDLRPGWAAKHHYLGHAATHAPCLGTWLIYRICRNSRDLAFVALSRG